MSHKAYEIDQSLLDDIGGIEDDAPTLNYSAQQLRLRAGFKEIIDFYHAYHRLPDARAVDIFEARYGIRLAKIAQSEEFSHDVADLDEDHILEKSNKREEPDCKKKMPQTLSPEIENLTADQLLSELEEDDEDSILTLKHVSPTKRGEVMEDVAYRQKCDDFDLFKPLFHEMKQALKTSHYETRPFEEKLGIKKGDFFILRGQLLYIADDYHYDVKAVARRRLRLIYDNGTENFLLSHSFIRALYGDKNSRRVIEVDDWGPLGQAAQAAQTVIGEDQSQLSTGHLYVVRLQSDDLTFQGYPIHEILKIGITSGAVKRRIINAEKDPTYLMHKVEIVRDYPIFHVEIKGMEALIHKVLRPAQIDVALEMMGRIIKPKEWFQVPLSVIDKIAQHINDGRLRDYFYDPARMDLIKRKGL